MEIEEIAAAFYTNVDAARELANRAMSYLDKQPGPIGTTKLVMALLPEATSKQMRGLLSHLYTARANGYLDGYYTRGTKKTLGGHLMIIWQAPASDGQDSVDIRNEMKAWEAAGKPNSFAEWLQSKTELGL